MSCDREPTNDLNGVRLLVIDDEAECDSTQHAWPVEFVAGDSCQCGRYTLLRGARGELRIEETTER